MFNLDRWRKNQKRMGFKHRFIVSWPGSFLTMLDSILFFFSFGIISSSMGLHYMLWATKGIYRRRMKREANA